MTKKKEVITTLVPFNQGALVQSEGPGSALATSLFADDLGAGTENVTAGDMAIPFISILQALSPQLRGDTKVHGAEEGLLFNTVTKEVYKSVILIPCAFNKVWNEWVDRKVGGGFVAQHSTDVLMATTKKDDKNQDVLPNGHILTQTAYHYCLLVKPDGTTSRVVLSMALTKLKKSRRWVSRMMDVKIISNGKQVIAPTFSQAYTVSTEVERKQNNDFYNFSISEPMPLTKVEVYLEARKFHQEVQAGFVKVQPPEEDTVAGDLPVEHNDNHF
jgi:hypothetical protein